MEMKENIDFITFIGEKVRRLSVGIKENITDLKTIIWEKVRINFRKTRWYTKEVKDNYK